MTPSSDMKITVKLADRDEVVAALKTAAAEIAALKAERDELVVERDEWERHYEELLAACGGTMP